MTTGFRRNPKEQQKRPSVRYSLAELLLDRYGVRYICQNPAILFDEEDPPSADPARTVSGNYAHRISAQQMDYSAAPGSPPPRSVDDLLHRADTAYRILDEIYAPYRGAGNG